MTPFTRITALAAALPMANLDTDKIVPGRFLKTVRRQGLGTHLFHDLRYDATGAERPDFVLNQVPWRKAELLVSFENFGCGSSREHAVWALADFGIRCVIAPSFGDIFLSNCFKNGLLPIILDRVTVDGLIQVANSAEHQPIGIDLDTQTLSISGHPVIPFEISPDKRRALLKGEDEISRTMEHIGKIETWERRSETVTR